MDCYYRTNVTPKNLIVSIILHKKDKNGVKSDVKWSHVVSRPSQESYT